MGMTGAEAQGCILADEMGLGKTLQTIALIHTMLSVLLLVLEVIALTPSEQSPYSNATQMFVFPAWMSIY